MAGLTDVSYVNFSVDLMAGADIDAGIIKDGIKQELLRNNLSRTQLDALAGVFSDLIAALRSGKRTIQINIVNGRLAAKPIAAPVAVTRSAVSRTSTPADLKDAIESTVSEHDDPPRAALDLITSVVSSLPEPATKKRATAKAKRAAGGGKSPKKSTGNKKKTTKKRAAAKAKRAAGGGKSPKKSTGNKKKTPKK